MQTKQQTDSILKWILDNESIQITYCGETYRDCDYQEVFTQLSCDGTSAEFRLKPKPTHITAVISELSHDYVSGFYDKSAFTCFEQKDSVKLNTLFVNGERVVILTEQCYNDLLGNSTLNLKGN